MMGRKARIHSSALITLSALLIIGIQSSCKHKGLNYSELDTVCYVRDISPIFQNSCAITGCHSLPSGENTFVFTSYQTIKKGLIPFDPNKSIIYKAIIGNGESLMPPGKALPENERILIRVWIGQGADSTNCPVALVKPEVPSIKSYLDSNNYRPSIRIYTANCENTRK